MENKWPLQISVYKVFANILFWFITKLYEQMYMEKIIALYYIVCKNFNRDKINQFQFNHSRNNRSSTTQKLDNNNTNNSSPLYIVNNIEIREIQQVARKIIEIYYSHVLNVLFLLY